MPRPNQPRWRAERGVWVSKISGKLVILARGRGARSEAAKELRRLLAEQDQSRKSGTAPALKLWALCDHFLDAAERDLAPETYAFYRRHLRSFLAHAGREMPASEVRPRHVSEWLAAERPNRWPGRPPTTLSDSTRAAAVTAVRRLFRWAKEQGYVEEYPLEGLKRPVARARDDVMNTEESKRLFEGAQGESFRNLLVVLSETGCRPREAARIEAGMIFRDPDRIVMDSKTTRRTGRKRVIYLTPRAAVLLADLARRHPEGPLLRNARGMPWTPNAIVKKFWVLRKKLGMGRGATAVAMRHLYVTDALEMGVPIATVAELVGHVDTGMVSKHYGRLRDRKEHLSEAAGKVRPDGGSGLASE